LSRFYVFNVFYFWENVFFIYDRVHKQTKRQTDKQMPLKIHLAPLCYAGG